MASRTTQKIKLDTSWASPNGNRQSDEIAGPLGGSRANENKEKEADARHT